MKNLKMSLAVLAGVLGFTAAVATSSASAARVNTLYGYNQDSQQWEPVKTGYTCDESEQTCTAQFSTPPSQGGEPIPGTIVLGDFTNGN